MEKYEGKGEQRGAFPHSRGCCSVLGLWLCWDAVSPELLRGVCKRGLRPAGGEAERPEGASQGLKCKFLHFILGGGVKVCPFLPLPHSPRHSFPLARRVLFGKGL